MRDHTEFRAFNLRTSWLERSKNGRRVFRQGPSQSETYSLNPYSLNPYSLKSRLPQPRDRQARLATS